MAGEPGPWEREMAAMRSNKRNLQPEDFELHEKLLRLVKGMIKAYEAWLEAKKRNQN